MTQNAGQPEPPESGGPPPPRPWYRRLYDRLLVGHSVRARMTRGAAWSTVAGVVSRSFFLLSSIIVARILGEVEFGKWGVLLNTVNTFVLFIGMRMGQTVTKHIAELRTSDPDRAGAIFGLMFLFALGGGTAVAVACAASAHLIAVRLLETPELATPLVLGSFTILIINLDTLLRAALAGFEAFRQVATIRFLESVLSAVAMTGLALLWGLKGVVIGYTFGLAVGVAVAVFVLRERFRWHGMSIHFRGALKEVHLFWRFSLPSFLAGLVMYPARWVPLMLVARQSGGYAGLGGYTAAQRWQSAIGFVPRHLSIVNLPILSSLKGKGDMRRYHKALFLNLAASGGIAALAAVPIMIASPWIMRLYGPSFVDNWDILVAVAGLAILQSMIWIVAQVPFMLDKAWWSFYVNLISGLVIVGGAWLLVPEHGIRGFVWSLGGGFSTMLVLNALVCWILLGRLALRPQT